MDKMATKAVRQFLMNGLQGMNLSRANDGTWTAKRSYFYRFGITIQKMVDLIKSLDSSIVITDSGDHFANWPKTSYLWVKFRCPFEESKQPKVAVKVEELGHLFTVTEVKQTSHSDKLHKARAYIFEKGESVIENLMKRRMRPVDIYRIALQRGLEMLALPTDLAETARWSQKAGCSCGCSPGFILDTTPTHTEFYVEITWNQEAVNAFLSK